MDITIKWLRDIELSNYLDEFGDNFTAEVADREKREQAGLEACRHCMMYEKCTNQFMCHYEEYHEKCTEWLLTQSKEAEFWLTKNGYLEGVKKDGRFELKLRTWSDKPLLDIMHEIEEEEMGR